MPEIIQDLRPAEEVIWDYYGTPIKAMRRTQLWRLADIHKIPYPKGCSKENLLLLLDHEQVRGRDLLKPPPGMTEETFWKLINGPRREPRELGGQMSDGQTNVDLLRDALEGVSHFETDLPEDLPMETGEPESDYANFLKSLSWQELKREARGQGMNVHGMKRIAIEEALCGNTP